MLMFESNYKGLKSRIPRSERQQWVRMALRMLLPDDPGNPQIPLVATPMAMLFPTSWPAFTPCHP
jgi:hypothetical protein